MRNVPAVVALSSIYRDAGYNRENIEMLQSALMENEEVTPPALCPSPPCA
jgi:hypothetical protein